MQSKIVSFQRHGTSFCVLNWVLRGPAPPSNVWFDLYKMRFGVNLKVNEPNLEWKIPLKAIALDRIHTKQIHACYSNEIETLSVVISGDDYMMKIGRNNLLVTRFAKFTRFRS